jgi:chemotaxis signal transduction protein
MAVTAVVFSIGQDLYAVTTAAVREVICNVRPIQLPTAPAALLGAFNLRGEVVPMFDTAYLLGVGTIVDTSSVVVVDTVAGPAGLAVNGLPRVADLDEEIATSELRDTLGMFAVGDDVAVLIDVESLLLRNSTVGASATSEVVVG